MLFGTPDKIVRDLQSLRTDLGLDGIMLETNCGGLIPHAEEKEALRLLCKEIMPAFR